METVYEAAGGELGMLLLARAWHARVMIDEVVSHAFEHGFHPEHDVRLAAYWGEALGGPPTYTERYGDETEVVRMHSGNGPHEEMNERAIACFDLALADVGIGEDDPIHRVLHDYFAWMTPFVNRFEASAADVPEGLSVPRWSWDGLVGDPEPGGAPAAAPAPGATEVAQAVGARTRAPADPRRLRLRELLERIVLGQDANLLAGSCDPECVVTIDGRGHDLAAVAAGQARVPASGTASAVEYDEDAWFEGDGRLGAHLWITTTGDGGPASPIEVVLVARLRAGRLYRLWARTGPATPSAAELSSGHEAG